MRLQRGLALPLEPTLVLLGALALTALLLPAGARARRERRDALALADLARIARAAAEAPLPPTRTTEASGPRDPWARPYLLSVSTATGRANCAGENGRLETPDRSFGPAGDDLVVPFPLPGGGR